MNFNVENNIALLTNVYFTLYEILGLFPNKNAKRTFSSLFNINMISDTEWSISTLEISVCSPVGRSPTAIVFNHVK